MKRLDQEQKEDAPIIKPYSSVTIILTEAKNGDHGTKS